MTMRKQNYAQKIQELRNEIEKEEAFMAPLIRESEKLDALRKERLLTKDELRRVKELIEIIHDTNVWLVKAKKEIKAFYTPVVA